MLKQKALLEIMQINSRKFSNSEQHNSQFNLVIAFLESPTYLPLSLLIILEETDNFPFT